jgi:uncharacterized membrane protein YozB (DUF420 family)
MTTTIPDTGRRPDTQHAPQIISAVAAGLASAAVVGLVGLDALAGDDPASMTTSLVENAGTLQLLAVVAGLAGAGLFVATARLARSLAGCHRQVALAAGTAVAVLFVAYLSATTAGADVASLLLAEPGPGVAESTLVALNVLGIARYAPSLALFAVGLLAGPALPRLLRWSAGLLAVATLVPVTGWVAALLAPVWLGVAGCLARRAPEGAR